MRKSILAASTALTLAGLTGVAFGQAAVNPITPGVPGAAFGASTGTSLPAQTYEPGTTQAYVRGRMYTDFAILGDSADNLNGKSSPIGYGQAIRLYWGFAGTTNSGLNYGAYAETRYNAGTATASGNTATNTIKYQQTVGYVGGKWGTLRFGNSYDATLMFMTGTFENIGDTIWDGDLAGLVHTATTVNWPFDENSGEYGDMKFTYLSPQWNGFDFGLSWQPQSAGAGYPQSATAGVGDPRLTTLTTGTFSSLAGNTGLRRERDMINLAGRYAGNLGPVGVIAQATVITGNTVGNAGLTGTTVQGGAQYKMAKPFAIDAGLVFSYGGFSVGGHMVTGKINPNGSNELMAVAAGHGSTTAILVGAQYVTGPWGFSVSALQDLSPGAYSEDYVNQNGVTTFGKRKEVGAVASVAYNYGPGATLALSAEYGGRRQVGYNFYTDSKNTTGNNTRAAGVILTNYFQW